MFDDVRFNARERSGEKRRAFLCRVTDGRAAAIVEGVSEEASPEFFPDMGEAKRKFVLLVPDIRIPVYLDYELKAVGRTLETLSAPAAA